MAMVRAPIETKVVAATAGSVAGTAVGGFILWLLGVTVWHVSSAAEHAPQAVAAVPGPVSALLLFVIGAVGTAVGGYVAPHTPRVPAPVVTISSTLGLPVTMTGVMPPTLMPPTLVPPIVRPPPPPGGTAQ